MARRIAMTASMAAGAFAAPWASAAPPLRVAPEQELVTLVRSHAVVAAPVDAPRRVDGVPARRPITGGPTVLPVVGRATSPEGVRFLRVLLPGRPNGREGWIAEAGTMRSTTSWHVIVRTASRQVRVYRRGRLVRSFSVIVGKRSTPTPTGRFFVEESIRMLPGSAGAPFALALSARSTVLQEFKGGPGQIALHGVSNIGGTPGTAVSHGCVRLLDRHIRWLAARIATGAPVTITR